MCSAPLDVGGGVSIEKIWSRVFVRSKRKVPSRCQTASHFFSRPSSDGFSGTSGMGRNGTVAAVLRLHDTASNQVRELALRDPGKLSLYVCGPTVYDVPHIGHARSVLTYDVLRRYAEWQGIEVTHAANITDVDDNIIDRKSTRLNSSHANISYAALCLKKKRDAG